MDCGSSESYRPWTVSDEDALHHLRKYYHNNVDSMVHAQHYHTAKYNTNLDILKRKLTTSHMKP